MHRLCRLSWPGPQHNPAMNEPEKIQEPRLWRDNGWTARVVKNEDDDGWAVSMTPTGRWNLR